MIQRLSMSKGNIRNVTFLQVHLPHQNQMAVTTERGRSIHEEAEGKAINNHTTKSHTTGGPGHGHHHRKADLRGHSQNHHHLCLCQRHLLQLA